MESEIEKLVKQPIIDKGYLLYGIEYKKEDGNWVLRIIIDLDEREVTLDDCVTVTELINPILDKADPIDNEYMLEVCSAGAEKELRNKEEYLKAVGKYVYVESEKENYLGYLEEVNQDNIVVKINLKGRMKKITILDKEIKFIRLAVKF